MVGGGFYPVLRNSYQKHAIPNFGQFAKYPINGIDSIIRLRPYISYTLPKSRIDK